MMTLCSNAVLADILLITHPETKLDSISREQIHLRWRGQTTHIANIPVSIVDMEEKHPLYQKFYTNVMDMSNRQLKAHWAKMVFQGKGFPPNTLQSHKEISQWVLEQPNRIAYIDSNALSEKDVKEAFKVLYYENIE